MPAPYTDWTDARGIIFLACLSIRLRFA